MIDEAHKGRQELVDPLLQFRNYGLQLPHHWSTVSTARRLAPITSRARRSAKSNIFVNKQNETKYFYQDLDQTGARLNGANKYTVTFAKGQTPPVRGFWSLTLYNQTPFLFAERHQTLLDRHQEQDPEI